MTYADTLTDNVANAEEAIAHYENAANREKWYGDNREPYLARQLALAQAYATLAVADVLARIYAGMPDA